MFGGFGRLEIKCLITFQHFTAVVIVARLYQSLGCYHNTSLGSVAQGAWKLVSWEIRKCHFWSDPCMFGYIF